ncbi:MAG: GldG family protein [Acidobacteriia bacterium]|nr:GldG family protein [Terriglobia bacterium]
MANWMKARQTKYAAYASVYILVILAVLGAANFLANRYDKTYDSTANKQFSLSDQSIKVVKGLKGDVHITYFDRDSQFAGAHGLLDRYSNLSPKVHVAYIDPVKRPQEARAAGFSRDTTILVDSGTRKEPAKSLTEEEITGALIRSLKSGERNACFVSGSGEHSLDDTTGGDGYGAVKAALESSNFKTRTISLLNAAGQTPAAGGEKATPAAGASPDATAKPEVPKDCTVLMIGGPRFAYIQPAVDAIKAYVENGGKAMIMLDPSIKLGKDDTQENTALDALLESWGVTLDKDLALDTSGIGRVFGLGPEVALVASYEPHQIVNPMKEIATAFPLSRTLEVKNTDKTTVDKLFSTGENSFATTNLSSGRITIDPKNDKKGPLLLAAAGTYNKAGRFVVVGTSTWVGNSLIRFNGNRDLFLNMINWLSADEDLISIRPKEPSNQALNVTGQRFNMMFWLSVVFFPLAVVGIGLGTWWKRR